MTPLPAATLVLVRERAGRIEAHLLLRAAGAAFMSGKYVFPGGCIDTADRDAAFWERHSDLNGKDLARRIGGGSCEPDALAYGVSAIRETLEEAGVFLAGGAASRKKETDRISALRLCQGLTKGWFRKEVEAGGWILAFSSLYRWAHWITPERMRPRFDTRFFVAFMPEGQACRPDLREITRGVWITPEEALKRNLTGEIPLSPPTLVTLQELLPHSTEAELLKVCRRRTWGAPLLPRLVPVEGGGVILEPWDKDYGRADPMFQLQDLEKGVLPAGAPFSKIWYNGKVWRPVAL